MALDLHLPPFGQLTAESAVVHWSGTGHLRHAAAPVLACKNPNSTVGLGDHISIASLVAAMRQP